MELDIQRSRITAYVLGEIDDANEQQSLETLIEQDAQAADWARQVRHAQMQLTDELAAEPQVGLDTMHRLAIESAIAEINESGIASSQTRHLPWHRRTTMLPPLAAAAVLVVCVTVAVVAIYHSTTPSLNRNQTVTDMTGTNPGLPIDPTQQGIELPLLTDPRAITTDPARLADIRQMFAAVADPLAESAWNKRIQPIGPLPVNLSMVHLPEVVVSSFPDNHRQSLAVGFGQPADMPELFAKACELPGLSPAIPNPQALVDHWLPLANQKQVPGENDGGSLQVRVLPCPWEPSEYLLLVQVDAKAASAKPKNQMPKVQIVGNSRLIHVGLLGIVNHDDVNQPLTESQRKASTSNHNTTPPSRAFVLHLSLMDTTGEIAQDKPVLYLASSRALSDENAEPRDELTLSLSDLRAFSIQGEKDHALRAIAIGLLGWHEASTLNQFNPDRARFLSSQFDSLQLPVRLKHSVTRFIAALPKVSDD